ncbi:MAG: hypothetical protein ABIJ93_04415 [candidate division WOR-3 bacterium]
MVYLLQTTNGMEDLSVAKEGLFSGRVQKPVKCRCVQTFSAFQLPAGDSHPGTWANLKGDADSAGIKGSEQLNGCPKMAFTGKAAQNPNAGIGELFLGYGIPGCKPGLKISGRSPTLKIEFPDNEWFT